MIYQPREDSYLLQEQVSKYTKGKSFLDMGAASGIQSLAAIKAKAKTVLAVDIRDGIIKHLKSKKIPAVKSDLFSKINGKFDLIAFNPPYLPEDKEEDKQSKITTTGGKNGDEIILRFLKQVKKHVNEKGKILLVVSSLTLQHRIKSLIKKLKMKHKIISEKKLFMEKLEVWEVTQ